MEQEFIERFERNVAYLAKNIPPDDIYPFTEKVIMTALFFLQQWGLYTDLDRHCEKYPDAKKVIRSILEFELNRCNDVDVKVDLMMDSFESE